MVKIRPSPFYLSLCLHVRGIAHRSEFWRPAPLLAVACPVPALRDRADVAIAFSTVPSSFQSQTRAKCVPESRLRDTPATRRRAPHRRRPCAATGSAQLRAEPPIRSMSPISVCSRAIPPAEPRADARAAPTNFAPSDQDPTDEIRYKPESTDPIPVNRGGFAKESPSFHKINPQSISVQKYLRIGPYFYVLNPEFI